MRREVEWYRRCVFITCVCADLCAVRYDAEDEVSSGGARLGGRVGARVEAVREVARERERRR